MILEIENLNITFDTRRGPLHCTRNVSFHLKEAQTLGIVGESGCGKSVTSLAIMGLLPPTAHVTASKFQVFNEDWVKLPMKQKRKYLGKDLSMIFQDPMQALNPTFTVGYQLAESIKSHLIDSSLTRKEIKERSIELLQQVGIPSPEKRLQSYAHELSGGMCQRIMIACAIACRPKLLIADEPTTALDVSIQAQILELLKDLQEKYKMGLILISHDVAVVSQMTKNIQVMYAGEIVEKGLTEKIVSKAQHPYTEGLLKSLPENYLQYDERKKLYSLEGIVPDLMDRPFGCQFHPRCPYVQEDCKRGQIIPMTKENDNQEARCLYPLGSS